jgi:hypothetical protein
MNNRHDGASFENELTSFKVVSLVMFIAFDGAMLLLNAILLEKRGLKDAASC